MSDKNWILVEFEGTYLAPHPEGFKDEKVTRQFHVQVEMKRKFLTDLKPYESLRGPFVVYYENLMKNLYPDFIQLYRFRMIEATELDGKKINDPRAMKHTDLLSYIQEKELPINTSLWDDQDLRHVVHLHEIDPKGAAKRQKREETVKGATIAYSNEMNARGGNVIRRLDGDKTDEPKGKKVKQESYA